MRVLPNVTATRYVTPLREGGSLPAIVEADDLGTYVVKFHGAGQGRKALVAEVIAGELARRLGLRMPDIVTVDLDPVIGRHEPDPDVQDLLKASSGRNLGIDYLPGSLGFDPLAWTPDPSFAAEVLWFDALIGNVDRSWRNPNLLIWHRDVWLIDHGASLYFHHAWASAAKLLAKPYEAGDHVLATFVDDAALAAAGRRLRPLVTDDLLREIVDLVPAGWLEDEPGFASAADVADAYVAQLHARAAAPEAWLPEVGPVRPARPPAPRGAGRPGWLRR
ncbi:HipA family kinase [Actinomadura sp. DC4]|uniref:HipA family kinase n=1 Tax=Actinomadura sp. DC4 TaxID=3055069 RepID=UPI0025B09ECA|nr:HipA family kinase [Actinomadura sp. DC4]MDN3356552.1 aminotransferase class I and II [Actinomadura sp. DC4]